MENLKNVLKNLENEGKIKIVDIDDLKFIVLESEIIFKFREVDRKYKCDCGKAATHIVDEYFIDSDYLMGGETYCINCLAHSLQKFEKNRWNE